MPGEMPYKSVGKRRKSVRKSVSKWYATHKAERAAYMRKYRRRRKKTTENPPAGPVSSTG